MTLLVQEDTVEQIRALFAQEWEALLKQEGISHTVPQDPDVCPACGHRGELVEGACADCGLHLA